MKKSIIVSVLFASLLIASGQTIDLTFTAIDNESYVQLDSIKVMNRTQGGDTVLNWPDTVLSLYIVGIDEVQGMESLFQVFQNYPNPVVNQTTISLYVPAKDHVGLIITDMLGRVIVKDNKVLDKGTHSFYFMPGEGNLNFFTAQWRSNSSSIKILQTAFHSGGQASLEYIGIEASTIQLKATVDIQSFNLSIGDELLYIGYSDMLQSGMLDAPEASETYTLQFATNIPCPGTPTVTYEGQVYNTIQIFSQCWLKENLNVGAMIPVDQQQSNNGIIEKYCYDNEPDSCTKYGGLYQWDEMMQYTTQQSTQGICPSGWHLPTDEEWKVLEGSVDSQYGIGDSNWDGWGYRGLDAGTNLKTTSGWNYVGNGTDLFDFSGLPGGCSSWYASFGCIGEWGLWWTSAGSWSFYAWHRRLYYGSLEVYREPYNYDVPGYSVRCLKD